MKIERAMEVAKEESLKIPFNSKDSTLVLEFSHGYEVASDRSNTYREDRIIAKWRGGELIWQK
uniref:Uncharacterized protein n=1 Tax=viral metagenome TaxID=1070528 RepID=A0A6M3LXI4_9ZZZZ